MLRKTLLALGVLALLGLSLQFGRTVEAAPTSVSVARLWGERRRCDVTELVGRQ
jgi:hypothetical protein